jgi:mannose-6-phosphate isomerase-like protein (cupin superfamily)
MTPQITTLDPIASPVHLDTILAQDGYTCSLLTLEPGSETPQRAAHDVQEHLLFVVDGEVTVRFGDVNTILNKDQALLVPQGRPHAIAGSEGGPAKLLRIDIPPRQVVVAPMGSFEN